MNSRLLLLLPVLGLLVVTSCIPENQDGYVWVARVIDGDTMVVTGGHRLRYLGIDTPELNHPVHGRECFATEATQRNRELVDARWVRVEADRTGRDEFGRLLRYVYVGRLFVNAELVRDGYARVSYRPPDTLHYEYLHQLEEQAKENGRGLWGSCGNAG